ncbi:MAG TPA: hypothetical protein VK017_13345 [Sphingobacterium sp.]|nr:hypothetical protein [Sphingobacterium sp.]
MRKQYFISTSSVLKEYLKPTEGIGGLRAEIYHFLLCGSGALRGGFDSYSGQLRERFDSPSGEFRQLFDSQPKSSRTAVEAQSNKTRTAPEEISIQIPEVAHTVAETKVAPYTKGMKHYFLDRKARI